MKRVLLKGTYGANSAADSFNEVDCPAFFLALVILSATREPLLSCIGHSKSGHRQRGCMVSVCRG
jgi:hypothetical protein